MLGLGTYTALFVWDQAPFLLADGWMGNDMRQNCMPSYRYHGTGLFADDLPTDYMEAFQPVGYRALLWLATLFVDPIAFCNVLGLLLTLAFVVFVVLAGREVFAAAEPGAGGRRAGLIVGATAAFLLLRDHEVARWIAGGLPRSMAYPAVAAFVWCWLSGHRKGLVVSVVAAGAFYPSAILACGPAWALSLVHREGGRWRLDRGGLVGLTVAGVACVLLAWPQLRPGDARIGPVVSLAEAYYMPELKGGGMVVEVPLKNPGGEITQRVGGLFSRRGSFLTVAHRNWSGRLPYALFLVLSALLVLTARRWLPRLPSKLLLLAAVTLLVYALARIVAFRLYVPGRIVRYTLPVLAALAIPAAFTHVLLELRATTRRRAALAVGLVLALGTVAWMGSGRKKHNAIHDYSEKYPGLMAYLETTDVDTLVAGHPGVMDYVPALARRRVFYNYEVAMPYYRDYNRELNRRGRRLFRALYARDMKPLKALRDEEGVDLLVVVREHLGDGLKKHASFGHFKKQMRALAARLAPGSSPLLHLSPGLLSYQDDEVLVIDLRRVPSADPSRSGSL